MNSVIGARSVRGAATVGASTRGHGAGKKVSARKTFGVVGTSGSLVLLAVVATLGSDNTGTIAAIDRARAKSGRLKKVYCDADQGFKRTFVAHCAGTHLPGQVVRRMCGGVETLSG